MFDFANSSYTTVIVTVVYAVVFPKLIVGDLGGADPEYKHGNLLWSVALSLSYVAIVISAPILGAIMDFSAAKKKFLFASYIFTVITTSTLYFVEPGYIALGVILLVLSNYGFSAGEAFVSSFLPDLGPPEDLGKISGFAWGLGYFGGLASTAIVIFGLGPQTLENMDSLLWIGPITAAFFLISGIPTFAFLKERGTKKELPQGETYLSMGFKRLGKTVREIKDYKDLVNFLVSLFFSSAGLMIVIAFAFIYGDQVIKWQESTMIIMFVVTQITAALGAVVFGLLQDKLGAKLTYILTLVLWIVAVVLIYGAKEVTNGINNAFGTDFATETVFVGIGALAGMGLGATQSAGRALVGLFSPESKSGEFFGLWGLVGKLAAIFGILGLGLLQAQFGLETSILFCGVLFLIGIFTVLVVDEKRGIQTAASHEGD